MLDVRDAKPRTGTFEPTAQPIGAHGQDGCNFIARQLLEVTQQEHGPLARWKVQQRRLHKRAFGGRPV
jgi:hypothetical protein